MAGGGLVGRGFIKKRLRGKVNYKSFSGSYYSDIKIRIEKTLYTGKFPKKIYKYEVPKNTIKIFFDWTKAPGIDLWLYFKVKLYTGKTYIEEHRLTFNESPPYREAKKIMDIIESDIKEYQSKQEKQT